MFDCAVKKEVAPFGPVPCPTSYSDNGKNLAFNNFTVLRLELTKKTAADDEGGSTMLQGWKKSHLLRCLGRHGFLFPCDAEFTKKKIESGTCGI